MLRKLALVIGVFVLAALVHAAPLATAEDAASHAVSGLVVDDAGNPVAEAYVYGWTSSSDGVQTYDKNVTAKDGSFTLHLTDGKGQLSASHPQYRMGASLDVVVSGDTKGLRLVLPTPPPRTAVVEGRVLDAAGNPIEGAQVTLGQGCCYLMEGETKGAPPPTDANETTVSSDSGGGSSGSAGSATIAPTRPAIWYDGDAQSATTGKDGKYRFETYAGPRQVTAYAKGYAQESATVQAIENQTVTADLRLDKVPDANAVLNVRVVDAKTGAPLAGAGVNLQNAEWSHYAYGSTGADGAVTLKSLPGWSTVNVYYYGYNDVVAMEGGVATDLARPIGTPQKQYYAYVATLRLAPGEQTLDVKLEPKPEATIVLTGYVVDPDAKTGVPDANVNVWNQDTGDWGSATTDATGSYKILVRPGHYTMNAWAQGHLPGAKTFVVADGEATKRVDVEAPAGEQRWAPCVDGCPEPMPLYAEKDAAGGASGAPAITTMEGRSTADLGAKTDAPQADGTTAAGDAATTRNYAYQGSGGGLPPYDANAASAETEQKTSDVPMAGVALVLAAIAALALALRRRA